MLQGKSTWSADIELHGVMNFCAPEALIPAWPSTACTCRRKLSTFAYRESPPRNCGMLPCSCIGEVWGITQARISCTSMWGGCAAGNGSLPRVWISFRQDLLQSGIVPVDVIVKVHPPVFEDNHSRIEDQNRNGVRQIYPLRLFPVHSGENSILVPAGIVA